MQNGYSHTITQRNAHFPELRSKLCIVVPPAPPRPLPAPHPAGFQPGVAPTHSSIASAARGDTINRSLSRAPLLSGYYCRRARSSQKKMQCRCLPVLASCLSVPVQTRVPWYTTLRCTAARPPVLSAAPPCSPARPAPPAVSDERPEPISGPSSEMGFQTRPGTSKVHSSFFGTCNWWKYTGVVLRT